MQLAEVYLKNFRACRDTTIELASDLTVIVGENASGKSALIDALRLSTFPATGRTTLWFSPDRDLNRHQDRGTVVSVANRFSDLNADETSVYMAHLVDADDDLRHQTSFATDRAVPRRNVISWSIGSAGAEDPEPALRRRISHVYLPPLRDAVRDLDGRDQAQLTEVFELILATEGFYEGDFVKQAGESLEGISRHPVSRAATSAIQEYFGQSTPPDREHVVGINTQTLELRRIVRLLRLQLAEEGVNLGDIASTGLGYANLLYISMIVLQLAKAKESDLTLLLVEEPEAHLHPQLQAVLLDFLQDQARKSGAPTELLGPAGKVQVVVTTHSPVLASTVSVQKIVVVARDDDVEWCAKATSLWSLGLAPLELRKIDRYLHATRAALLFSRNVLLVEGTAELVLLPALARHQLAEPTGASTSLRQFISSSIISVDGVDFEPFLGILLHGPHPRVDRVLVVTDGDSGAGEARRAKYNAAFGEAVAAGRLKVEVGGTTLEAEVFAEKQNEALMREAYKTMHPRSSHHWDKVAEKAGDLTGDERAAVFVQALRANNTSAEVYLDVGKGEFSHLVAEAINEAGESGEFVVPGYLCRAIEWITHVESGSPRDTG